MGHEADEPSFRSHPQKEKPSEKQVMSGRNVMKLSLSPGKFRALYFLSVSAAWRGGVRNLKVSVTRQRVSMIS